jgi:hypothetical protein
MQRNVDMKNDNNETKESELAKCEEEELKHASVAAERRGESKALATAMHVRTNAES